MTRKRNLQARHWAASASAVTMQTWCTRFSFFCPEINEIHVAFLRQSIRVLHSARLSSNGAGPSARNVCTPNYPRASCLLASNGAPTSPMIWDYAPPELIRVRRVRARR